MQAPPTVARVLERLSGVRATSAGWTARCPAHPDRSPSLSVACGREDRVLVRCFAGCTLAEITGSLGLPMAALFDLPRAPVRLRRPLTEREMAFRIAYKEARRQQAVHERHRSVLELSEDIRTAEIAVTAIRAWVTGQNDPECEDCWELLALAAEWEREARRVDE